MYLWIGRTFPETCGIEYAEKVVREFAGQTHTKEVGSDLTATRALGRLGRLCLRSGDQVRRRMQRILVVIVYASICLCGCASVLQNMLDGAVDSVVYSMEDRTACRKRCRTEEGPDYEKCYNACLKQRNLSLKETRREKEDARSEVRHEDEMNCNAGCHQKNDSDRQECLRDCQWERASSFSDRLNSRVREKRAKQQDETERARGFEKIDRSLGH
jgi:hypothetical protein